MSSQTLANKQLSTKKTAWSAKELCLAAVMTAVVFLATFVPRIPIPLGYAHLGDAAIFLMVLLLPRRPALLAACLGSALSDLLGGFPLWILPTLLIKFVMGCIVVKFSSRTSGFSRLLAACLLASVWMAFGYTVFGALLYGSISAALASAPGLVIEGIVNTAVALILFPLLNKQIK